MTGRNFPLGDLLSPPRPSVNSNQREYLANLPNLRRLFVEARTEVEENEYSRTAV
ncbi:unnamed protein product [Penicillium manginii]